MTATINQTVTTPRCCQCRAANVIAHDGFAPDKRLCPVCGTVQREVIGSNGPVMVRWITLPWEQPTAGVKRR